MSATAFQDTYEIKSVIGKGGMSTVYLAEHKRLHTKWAVKEVRTDQRVQVDFLAESNILKRLQHPMLPRIVDIFEEHGRILLVEDFVEGITLETWMSQQGQLEENLGLQWFKDLCGVLDYLHNQRPNPIIYRDMKPANIMLQPDGTLKLIDFGIAREYKQGSQSDTTYIGTKGYAAPEQFGKAQTDARTDIYSLGVTMYHLLTGKSPYEPPYDFVPARQLAPKLSHGMEYILSRCVSIEPETRYQTVAELLEDLRHIYHFDEAYQKVQAAKRIRVGIVAAMALVSIGMIVGGWMLMGQEKEAAYVACLDQAERLYRSDYDGALVALNEAEAMFPQRVESYRQRIYAKYLNREYQDCVDYGTQVLEQFPDDGQSMLTVASAYFELGEYEKAANGFYNGAQYFDMNADNLRDYAVSLGRLGRIDEAEDILKTLTGLGAKPEVTAYVQGEVAYAKGDYVAAEEAFKEVLEETDETGLRRRCYIALGDVYRDCTALVRTMSSPIATPATKAVEVLSVGIMEESMRYDSSLWETLGMAYFEAFHTDPNVPAEYLTRAAECFQRVIELGVTKDYLYSNLYTIYYEQQDYEKAGMALDEYQTQLPDDYMPHALRGILLITLENQKSESSRDYSQALAEYETAGSMLRNEDNTVYYQQLGSLIDDLRENSWL